MTKSTYPIGQCLHSPAVPPSNKGIKIPVASTKKQHGYLCAAVLDTGELRAVPEHEESSLVPGWPWEKMAEALGHNSKGVIRGSWFITHKPMTPNLM